MKLTIVRTAPLQNWLRTKANNKREW
jgi:hypothetical protein